MASTATATARRKPTSATRNAKRGVVPSDVLTIQEAASYLRTTEAEVLKAIQSASLPARTVGDEWRIHRSAIDDWLRTPVEPTGKAALLALAGHWKDDPTLEALVADAYAERERSKSR